MWNEQRAGQVEEGTPSWSTALVRGLVSTVRRALGRQDDQVGGSVRTVSVAFFANLVVAAAKYVGFFLSGSSAMLAESFHSTAVTVNQGLLLRGNLVGQRKATPQHPFGFGQERYFWAFVVSVAIFGIGSVLSLGRGVLALTGSVSHEITQPWIPLAALTVGLVMDGASFVVAARQSARDKGQLSYRQYVERSKDPEIPVVLLEDSAAIVGLFFAYLGVGLAILTGNDVYDAVASILIGLLLAAVSFTLARKMKSLLIGEPAAPEQAEEIDAVLTGDEAVHDVVYVRSLHLGPEDLFVEAKVVFEPDLSAATVAEAIDRMEGAIRDRVKPVRVVAIEPDTGAQGDIDVPAYQRDTDQRP